jgi:hypothetical protein
VQNQPLPRALGQLALDVIRESPRMVPVALPDYLRFGPVNGLRLFHELTLSPPWSDCCTPARPDVGRLGWPGPAHGRRTR